MKKIALIRVDDRLMHGQVVVSWIPYLKVDEMLIIDDEYATDEFMTLLVKGAAPDSIKLSILSLNQASEYLNEDDEGTRILILIRNIGYIKKLLELNVNINKINLGNLGSNSERKKIYNSVYLSDSELSMLKEISKQCQVEIKMLPGDKGKILK